MQKVSAGVSGTCQAAYIRGSLSFNNSRYVDVLILKNCLIHAGDVFAAILLDDFYVFNFANDDLTVIYAFQSFFSR